MIESMLLSNGLAELETLSYVQATPRAVEVSPTRSFSLLETSARPRHARAARGEARLDLRGMLGQSRSLSSWSGLMESQQSQRFERKSDSRVSLHPFS